MTTDAIQERRQPAELTPSPMIPAQMAGNAAVASLVARERYEMEGAILMARSNPRDEVRAGSRILELCERPGFANEAVYQFPRGGTNVKGPSVKLARQMERVWGNIMSGFRVLSMDDEHTHLQGFALDLETNTRKVQEHKFRNKIQRKSKKTGEAEWIDCRDERELRELIGKHGSILERNCVLRLIPSDITDDALAACERTQRKAADGDLSKSRAQTIRAMAHSFARLDVTLEMLERKLGHVLAEITQEELADLRQIYKALEDGEGKTWDYFQRNPGQQSPKDIVTPQKVANAKGLDSIMAEQTQTEEQPTSFEEDALPSEAEDLLRDAVRASKMTSDQWVDLAVSRFGLMLSPCIASEAYKKVATLPREQQDALIAELEAGTLTPAKGKK